RSSKVSRSAAASSAECRILLACRFIVAPHCGQIRREFIRPACSFPSECYLLPPVPECLCHPDKFIQELTDAADECLIPEFALRREDALDARKIHVPENGHEPQFTHDREQALDHPCTTKWSG